MPTVEEILLQSGFTKEKIATLDAQAIEAFGKVLTTAEQAQQSATQLREQAEEAKRFQQHQYETEIAPAIDKWGNESAQYKAEIAFYRAQNEAAKSGGFIPGDAPGFTPPGSPGGQPRGPNGEYVAGGGVPGSPTFMTQNEAIGALSNVNWTNNEYFRLYGTVPPDDFENLVAEAGRSRMPYKEYVEKKYGFTAKRAEKTAAVEKEKLDRARAEGAAESDKKWAERVGNNPNVRVGNESQFADIRKGIQTGNVKDPTTFKSKEERRQATSQLIQKDIAENMAGAKP